MNFCIPFRDVHIFLSKTLNSRNNLFKNQLYMLICACLKSNMIIIKCSVVILEKNIFKYFALYMYMSIYVQLSFPLWDPLRSELVTDVDNFESYKDVFLKISQTVTQ